MSGSELRRTTPTSRSDHAQAATTNKTDFGGRFATPTTAKSDRGEHDHRGRPEPRDQRHREQAAEAGADEVREVHATDAVARPPSSTETMTPNAMNVANSAKQISPSRTKFLNDARVP